MPTFSCSDFFNKISQSFILLGIDHKRSELRPIDAEIHFGFGGDKFFYKRVKFRINNLIIWNTWKPERDAGKKLCNFFGVPLFVEFPLSASIEQSDGFIDEFLEFHKTNEIAFLRVRKQLYDVLNSLEVETFVNEGLFCFS